MPFNIQFERVPHGYAAHSAKEGEQLRAITREFISYEAGTLFIDRLEGISRTILGHIPFEKRPLESTIDHLVALINADGSATVYINELLPQISMRAKRAIKKGSFVTLDDILDVQRLTYEGIGIAKDVGIVVVLSSGWRKGLFYDLNPICPPDFVERDFDVEATLGQYYAYILFQNLLAIPEATWEELRNQDWFPFIHLPHDLVQRIIQYASEGRTVDDMLDEIAEETRKLVGERLGEWKANPILEKHFKIFEKAYEEFCEDDFISATGLLFPRIEGVLRSNFLEVAPSGRATQGNLVSAAIDHAELPPHEGSLLLPERFRRFLVDHYFRGFDPNDPDCLSRHTVAHGVAPVELFNKKGATLGFLVLLQLLALIPIQKSEQDASEQPVTPP
ncbi:MAG: hypothetical protein JNK37_09530 [Verrucomicrobiales bacterium]|nr:hypothetical protein [Verrucomicrobiales bacterium]